MSSLKLICKKILSLLFAHERPEFCTGPIFIQDKHNVTRPHLHVRAHILWACFQTNGFLILKDLFCFPFLNHVS